VTGRIAIVALFSLLSLFVLACEGEAASSTPAPHPAQQPQSTKVAVPNPGAQPEAPPADPGPHNTATEAVVRVAWMGERTGHVEISINHVIAPQIRAPRPVKFGGSKYYTGLFERTISLSGVTHIGFTWYPEITGMPAQCSIQHLGLIAGPHGAQGVDSGPCAASWTP
jgi:hypothetical protein